jgi:hypothetical protein
MSRSRHLSAQFRQAAPDDRRSLRPDECSRQSPAKRRAVGAGPHQRTSGRSGRPTPPKPNASRRQTAPTSCLATADHADIDPDRPIPDRQRQAFRFDLRRRALADHHAAIPSPPRLARAHAAPTRLPNPPKPRAHTAVPARVAAAAVVPHHRPARPRPLRSHSAPSLFRPLYHYLCQSSSPPLHSPLRPSSRHRNGLRGRRTSCPPRTRCFAPKPAPPV